jgi:glycosyltransferase involved in cell wall biosynthesis
LNISQIEVSQPEAPPRKGVSQTPSGDSTPLVSVIVIAKDEERTIGKCMSSILGQDYANFEVIFVNSNSADHTLEIVESLVPPSGRVLLTTSNENAAATARNAGIRLAHGQAIAFVDGDCYLDEHWLRRAVSYLQNADDPHVAAVGGPFVQVPSVRTETSSVISEIESTALGRGGSTLSYREGRGRNAKSLSLTGAIFWSYVIRQVGFLNDRLRYCEDSEFCLRIRSSGYRLLSFGDLGAFHTPKYGSLREFGAKMWNYGVGRGRAVRYNWRLMTGVGMAALAYLIVFSAMLFLGFALGFAPSKLIAILLGVAYVATISGFSITVSIRHGSLLSFFLGLAAFLALHIPYTIGLMAGMITPRGTMRK